jgi:hypothetical protein
MVSDQNKSARKLLKALLIQSRAQLKKKQNSKFRLN